MTARGSSHHGTPPRMTAAGRAKTRSSGTPASAGRRSVTPIVSTVSATSPMPPTERSRSVSVVGTGASAASASSRATRVSSWSSPSATGPGKKPKAAAGWANIRVSRVSSVRTWSTGCRGAGSATAREKAPTIAMVMIARAVGTIQRPESKSGTTLRDAVMVAMAAAMVAAGRMRVSAPVIAAPSGSPHRSRHARRPRCSRDLT